jgi:hypothetical protein
MAVAVSPLAPETAPTDYLYDVFLSYTHAPPFGPWARGGFLDLFEQYLRNALFRHPNIFYDATDIKHGDAWPLRIKRALAASRCLVAVWSPDYFISEWCVRECCVMLTREQKLGYRTINNPSGLIVPVRVFATEHLPEAIRKLIDDTHYLDAQDYTSSVENYKATPEYGALEKELKKWVFKVADVINKAPAWENDWLSPPFIDDALPPCEQRLRPNREVNCPKPSIA